MLGTLFFWLALLAVGGGFLGIGMTVATLAKTQRAAFMGAMCYLLSVSLRPVHLLARTASRSCRTWPSSTTARGSCTRDHRRGCTGSTGCNLAAAGGLAVAWMAAAGWLFRRRGWQ